MERHTCWAWIWSTAHPRKGMRRQDCFFMDRRSKSVMDKPDGLLDDTTGQRGGRPPMTFYCPYVSGGGTVVNKSGYSCTVICQLNMEGEPFPPHFQLKTLAKIVEGQHVFLLIGLVTLKTPLPSSATWKGSHCRVPLEWMRRQAWMLLSWISILPRQYCPLYPNIADVDQRRVILKVDSGPGRMNVEMLARLHIQNKDFTWWRVFQIQPTGCKRPTRTTGSTNHPSVTIWEYCLRLGFKSRRA